MIKAIRKRLFFCLALLVIVSLGIFYLGLRGKPEDVVRIIKKAGFWSPFVYIIIFSSTHIIAPLGGTPVFFAGYILFGGKVQIYTYSATLLSATVNFWLSRKWGRGLVARLAGKKNIEKIDQFTQDYGVKSLIFLRLLQGHLTDFISYAYGLTNMRFLPYIVITALAPIPWLLLWQLYIFKRAESLGELAIWWFATLIPLLVISGLFVSKYKTMTKFFLFIGRKKGENIGCSRGVEVGKGKQKKKQSNER